MNRSVVNKFLSTFTSAINSNNTILLKQIFTLSTNSLPDSFASSALASPEELKSTLQSLINGEEDCSNFICHFIKAWANYKNHNLSECCNNYEKSITYFLSSYYKDTDNEWTIQLMKQFCHELYHTAVNADLETSKNNNNVDWHKYKNNYSRGLMDWFATCYGDKSKLQNQKIQIIIVIVNYLYRLYFLINNITIKTCTVLYNQMKKMPINLCSKSDQITYHYYIGRILMFTEQYSEGVEHLEYAFIHCHKNYFNNRRRILKYLVPMQLMIGKMINLQLVEQYKLNNYLTLLKCLKNGNIGLYDKVLEENENEFISTGVYLIFERLRYIVYRNLFMNTLKILEKPQEPLSIFLKALEIAGENNADLDQLECILANLIAKKFIKAYIAHKKSFLVFRATGAFPPFEEGNLSKL